MTLVVSDISRLGVIMVGDSAVSRGRESMVSGAVKVQYSTVANIGVALWGNANVGSSRMDYWISDFIQNFVQPNDTVENVGQKIVEQLNPILSASGKPWKDLVRGIHLAGYRNGNPCLFHVHTGHDTEPAHELTLYMDYPDGKGWSEYYFNFLLEFGFIQLRNGYHPLFAPLFEHVLEYSKQLRANFNISLPQPTLASRLEFYKLLVRFVAGTLVASGERQAVNDIISAVAFNKDGLVIDERLQLQETPTNKNANLDVYF